MNTMPYPWDLITERNNGKLAKCWLAATLSTKTFHQKFKNSTINNINLCQMCDYIENIIERNNDAAYGKCSLYLSSQLAYGAVKILSYQTSNLEKDIIDIRKMLSNTEVKKREKKRYYDKVIDSLDVSSMHSAQLHEDIHLLPDEPDIDFKLRNRMEDAACLEFGALTEEEISFIYPPDGSSLEMVVRSYIENTNVDNGLDTTFELKKTLPSTEEFYVNMYENQNNMTIFPVHDLPVEEQEHRTSLSKRMLPAVAIEETDSIKSALLTPQKRQSRKEEHIETPSKRRRLRFDDEPDVDKVVTPPIPETADVPTLTADHPLEPSQNLELVQNSPLLIEKRLQKKKVFIDKNTKLSQKIIRKWLDNINAHTVPSTIPNAYMPTLENLFKGPSTSFTSIHARKWNKSLSALFHKHNVVTSKQKAMPMEYGESLEKSTEFTRFEDESNKPEGLSELFSTLGKTLESSVHTAFPTSDLEHSSILQKKWYKEKPINDSRQEIIHPNIAMEVDLQNLEQNLEPNLEPNLEQNLDQNIELIDIEQSAYPDLKTHEEEKEKHQKGSQSSESSPLTKQEMLALLEVHWRNADIVRFTDVIEPDTYNKYDAVCCYVFLLELHKEKKITLEQAVPYDILWIRKYSHDTSEDDSIA